MNFLFIEFPYKKYGIVTPYKKKLASIYPDQIIEGSRTFWRLTPIKYKQIRKWMGEFLSKFANHGVKIAENSIHINKSINLL